MDEEQRTLLQKPLIPTNGTEPLSVTNKKPFFDYISMLLCFSVSPPVKFSPAEMHKLRALGIESDVFYDPANPTHSNTLKALHRVVFDHQDLTNRDYQNDPAWTSFGFQNSKPHTDFRGGGFLALQIALDFARRYPQVVKEIMRFSEIQPPFLLACVIITSTFRLKNFFHFGLISCYKKKLDNGKTCSRKALKCFLNFAGQLLDPFTSLVNAYTLKMFNYWQSELALNPRITILDFKTAEDTIDVIFKQHFEKFADNAVENQRFQIEEFIDLFSRLQINQHITPFVKN